MALFSSAPPFMGRALFILLAWTVIVPALGQTYTSLSIFAHNDYVKPEPFYAAYAHQVGFIEADIFFVKNELLVAHTAEEIDSSRTLEALYLKPLDGKITANNGSAYADPSKLLTLMIDLKTEGVPTLDKLVAVLNHYPKLTSCRSLQITVSGNVPDPYLWKNYPAFIHFDGRPGITYTRDQLDRIALISTSFRDHTKWKGDGQLLASEQERIAALVDSVHARGKKIRFWATPDLIPAWSILMKLKVDVLNTDDVPGLAAFLQKSK